MKKPLLILCVILAAGWAAAQMTYGNVFRLGSVDSLPTPNVRLRGGIVFDNDAGVPKYTDGSNWLTMGGGSSGSSYWVDGGVVPGGTGAPGMAPITYIGNPTAGNNSGTSLDLRGGGLGIYANLGAGSAPALKLQSQRTTSNTGDYATLDIVGKTRVYNPSGGFGGTVFTVLNSNTTNPYWTGEWQSDAYYVGQRMMLNGNFKTSWTADNSVTQICSAAQPIQFATSNTSCNVNAVTLTTAGVLQSNQSSGNNAFYSGTNGARWDFGSAANDYAISDGTGISTPGHFASTRAFNTTSVAGISSNALGLSAHAASIYEFGDNFPSNVALSFMGNNSTLRLTYGTSNFPPSSAPLHVLPINPALAHPTHSKGHTLTMGIGIETSGCPTIREHIGFSGSDTAYSDNVLVGLCTTNPTSATVVNSMRAYSFTTGATNGATAGWYVSDAATVSGGGTNMRPFTQLSLLPKMCARVSMPTGYTGRMFVGLFSGVPSTGSSDPDTPGIFWRYDSSVSTTNWYMCGRNNSTTSCTVNTNTTWTAGTPIELCIEMGNSTTPMWFTNGRYTEHTPATLVSPNVNVTPFIRHENLSAAAQNFHLYSLSVESW